MTFLSKVNPLSKFSFILARPSKFCLINWNAKSSLILSQKFLWEISKINLLVSEDLHLQNILVYSININYSTLPLWWRHPNLISLQKSKFYVKGTDFYYKVTWVKLRFYQSVYNLSVLQIIFYGVPLGYILYTLPLTLCQVRALNKQIFQTRKNEGKVHRSDFSEKANFMLKESTSNIKEGA